MRQKIQNNWKGLKKDFVRCQKSAMGLVKVASVDETGVPNITPIGSMFLGDDQTGFFCNRFPQNLNRNLKTNNRICVIAVNASKWFWMKSLFKGRFGECPGIRLYGEISRRRKITVHEKQRFEKMVRPYRFLKGYDLLWKDMQHASDIRFDEYEYFYCGEMRAAQSA